MINQNENQTFVLETSHSNELGELFGALAKAQAKIGSALKDKKNPFFKSQYADLTSVWEACREQLGANNLSIIQTTEGNKAEMFLTTWLGHSSGQWMKSKIPLFISKQDPQALGSAITYARRYALSAMVGVCPEDDDAEKAMTRNEDVRKSHKVEPIAIEENPKDIARRFYKYAEAFTDENPEEIVGYLFKCKTALKKSTDDLLAGYHDLNLFHSNFKKWKTKQEEKKAAMG